MESIEQKTLWQKIRGGWPRTLSVPRPADFIIMQSGKPYMHRWWVIPRNKIFNIYLHKIVQSDDDRALHDHPWWNVSILLKGGYYEHTPHRVYWRTAGGIYFRKATASHRLELDTRHCRLFHGGANATEDQALACEEYDILPCWSLFITGSKIREWGFHCKTGWRHWREFTGVKEGEARGDEAGPGCGE